MITIANLSFATKRPDDLTEQCLATTGCSDTELAVFMARAPIAHLVAQALTPFIKADELPDIMTLTNMIAEAGTVDVAANVAALLCGDEPEDEPEIEG